MTDIKKGLSDLDRYALMETLSILDAASLIAGVSPSQVCFEDQYGEWTINTNRTDPPQAREDFTLALNAVKRAILNNKLRAKVAVTPGEYIAYIENNIFIDGNSISFDDDIRINRDYLCKGLILEETLISRDDLKGWLKSLPCYPEAFFQNQPQAEYLDETHPNYSPMLALCIGAWLALKNQPLAGNAPVQALKQQITTMYPTYKLTVEQATPTIINNMASITSPLNKSGRPTDKSKGDLSKPSVGLDPLKLGDSEVVNKATVNQDLVADFMAVKRQLDNDYQNTVDVDLPF
jgi:hypothetical protein